MAVSNFTNVFGEPASTHDLEHIFDVINENNDDRIQFREFSTIIENCGMKCSRDDARKVFEHIASLSGDKIINKHAWLNGVSIASQLPLCEEAYRRIIIGGQYEPQPGRAELDLDEITKTLKDIKADWRKRIECMESLCRQLTTDKMSTDKFHSIFRSNHVGLTKQARDRRSNVMRVACETEGKLIRKWKKEFSKYGSTLIEYMYELIRLPIAVNNMYGKNVLICLVKHCPDRSKCRFLEALGKEATTSKFQSLKADLFEILLVYFHHQEKSLKQNEDWWKMLMSFTKKGVEDVDQIRNAALHLLAAIQVERHDLAFPIIKSMNEHLRKRYESEYQISRGSSRGSKKKSKHSEQKDEYLALAGSNEHVRKHTWSTTELMKGFAEMQLKQAETKKKKKKEKDKTKVKAKFPEPPPGQFFNPFGESVTTSDIEYAFEFIDIRNDHRITIDEMRHICDPERLDIEKADKLFSYLDVNSKEAVSFEDFKQALAEKKSKLLPFWYKVLGGKALEESPKPNDYELDDANQLLTDSKIDYDVRIRAMHSITRKMCMKLSEEKFHKLFKKCLPNLIGQLYDRKSYVIREACICLGKIMIARRAQFVKFATRTLEALYELIKLNDEKIHTSAHQAAKVLVRFIPDSKKFPIFAIVSKGCCERTFALTRISSFEYVNHVLARMVRADQDRSDRFWSYMDKILQSGLSDADQAVRDAAYSALAKTDILRPEIGKEYYKSLKKSQKEKYQTIKQYVLEHIEEEDFGVEGPGLLVVIGRDADDVSSVSSANMDSPKSGNTESTKFSLSVSSHSAADSSKKHKKGKSSGSNHSTPRMAKGAKSASPRIMDKGRLSPGITNDSRFTLTPEGFAELGAKYKAEKEAKEKADKEDSRKSMKAQQRKNTYNVMSPNAAKKSKSKSPNPRDRDRERLKPRSGTVDIRQTKSARNVKRPTSSRSAKKRSSDTNDVVPTRTRQRSNIDKKRPNTTRVSDRKKSKGANSDSLKKSAAGKTKTVKKKKKESMPKMSMQEQARQALCITAHKSLVQAFIEKTENLMGTINFTQFRECLQSLALTVGKGDALKAFSELDEEKEEELNMEEFAHAVHVAYPEYDLLWKQLQRSKYRYYATLEPMMSLEEIKATIIDKKASWKEKTKAMRCAVTTVCDAKRKDDDVTAMVKKLMDAFIAALRSNNQIVVREACVSVATMAKERTVCLKGVVGKLLKTCWELLDVKIPLIKFSAGECLKIVIKYVPDDSDNKYLKTLIQGTMLHDFKSVRQSCYECIIVMILRAGNPNNSMGNDFWKRIRQIIVDGMQSKENEVREYAFHCLYAFEKSNSGKAQRLIESLDAETVQQYKQAVFADIETPDGSESVEPSPSPQPPQTGDQQLENDEQEQQEQQQAGDDAVDVEEAEAAMNGEEEHKEDDVEEAAEEEEVEAQPGAADKSSPSPPPSAPKQKSVPKPIETEADNEDQKVEEAASLPNGHTNHSTSAKTSGGFVITPKAKKQSDSNSLMNGGGGNGNLSPTTPIPFNDKLSTKYDERKKQVEDVYNELDESKQGHLNRFKAMKFLKELMNVNMRNAEIVLTGLDSQRTGKFTKTMLINWVYAHSPEMEPNPYLYREADSFCWLALRRTALEQRIQLYSQLLSLEKTDKNYKMVFDLEHKICVLTYLLKQC